MNVHENENYPFFPSKSFLFFYRRQSKEYLYESEFNLIPHYFKRIFQLKPKTFFSNPLIFVKKKKEFAYQRKKNWLLHE